MAENRSSRIWAMIRKAFRWFRILTLFVLFLVVFAAIYFNSIGLPGFLKRPLLAHLHEKGWDVQFSAMRWHFYRGVVLEQPTFTHTNQLLKFAADEAALDISVRELQKSRLKLKLLTVANGTLHFSPQTNSPPLELTGIDTRIRFKPENVAALESFAMKFHGARIELGGAVTNFAAARPLKPADPDANRKFMSNWVEVSSLLDKLQFPEPPELKLTVHADLQDPSTTTATLAIAAGRASTPWGKLDQARITADMVSSQPLVLQPCVHLNIAAIGADTLWGKCKDFNYRATIAATTNLQWSRIDAFASMNQLHIQRMFGATTANIRAVTAQAQGTFTRTSTNALPAIANGRLRLVRGAVTLQGTNAANRVSADLPEGEVDFSYDPSQAQWLNETDETLGFWRQCKPLTFGWDLKLSRLTAFQIAAEKFTCSGNWKYPNFQLSSFVAQLYSGSFQGSVDLDVDSRSTRLALKSNFDVQKLEPVLPASTRRFFAKWTYQKPPVGSGDIRFTMPSWTNRHPDWRGEFLPTLEVDAHISGENGSYRGISALSASTDIHYSKLICSLPNIHVKRAEGEMDMALEADDGAGTYIWNVKSAVAPSAFRGHLNSEQQKLADDFRFTNPPLIEAEITGSWTNPEPARITATVQCTNFSFRGVDIGSLETRLHYTNQVLRFKDVHLTCKDRQIDAPEILVSLRTNRVFLHKVHSTVDPMLVAQCIGKDAVDAIEPFRFEMPPVIDVEGAVTGSRGNHADLQFTIDGDRFSWGPFHASHASGTVHWLEDTMTFTNGHALAYGGESTGWAFFDFAPKGKTDYRFQLQFENVDARSLFLDLGHTNKVEGLLAGAADITSADTTGYQTWQGSGSIRLRDGLIWEIPVFGVFSPILDAIAPGVGKNRARSAAATFAITNGVVFSDDLEIRASTVRMQYRGWVDYQGRINARVEAEILRDAWLIGKVVSVALSPVTKLFEYKVSGTVSQPKTQPVYVPKFLMMALRPFHTLKHLLPDKEIDASKE